MNRTKMINILMFGLLFASAQGVVNKKDAQKREAPFIQDSYGPPHHDNIGLPAPVYGIPDGPVAKYPPPPPDIPPPIPHQQYGVPILKYGPPKVNIEYGPPKFKPQFHQKPIFHGPPQKEASFFDQIKSTFGFGGGQSYGPPPPPQHHHKPHFPKQSYGPPNKGFGGQQHFGNNFGSSFGNSFGGSSFGNSFGGSFGGGSGSVSSSHTIHHSAPVHHSAPAQIHNFGNQQKLGPQFPNPHISCDGWKPIPGPSTHIENSYGPPATGGGYQNGNINLESQAQHDIQVIENHGHADNHVQVQEQIFELPVLGNAQPFHAEINSIGHNGDFNGLKSGSFEISSNHISDSYGPPASGLAVSSGSYGPPSLPSSYGPPSLPSTYGPPKSNFHIPSSGLLPPSGVYGVPPGGSYHSGLAISHGSVTGNLKPWPVPGSAPKRPLVNRQPVPNGLLESIGHNVKHLDQFGGVRSQHQDNNIYLPPVHDLPIQGLNSLPLQSPARPFLTQHNTLGPQALPLIQEPRGIGHDCGHGPSNLQFQQQQFIQPIQDSYGPPPSGNIFTSSGNSGGGSFSRVQSHLHTSYDAPASGLLELPAGNIPHETYGVPKFNNFGHGGDSLGFGSQIRTETVKVSGEKVNSQAGLNSIDIVEKSNNKPEDNEEEQTKQDVVGLTGLNVISAQKSQSITIPVQGARGNYQLQFQSAGPNGQSGAPHEQLLSEGLLQQILSAIEQPGEGSNGQPQTISIESSQNLPQVSQEPHEDHDDVKIFLKSPEAEVIINEPEMN